MPSDTKSAGPKETNRKHLTISRIAAFNPEKEALLWDVDMPRLAVRARGAKGKKFVFYGTFNYKAVRIVIGDATAGTIEAARQTARRYQRMIDEGLDPREVLRQEDEAKEAAVMAEKAAEDAAKRAQEEAARYTLRALCEAYTAHLAARGKDKSAAATRSAFKCHVFSSDVAALPAKSVTPHHVAALVRKVREAGKERAAGILRSYLSAAYNAAKRAPFDSALPADLIAFGVEGNPVDAIPAIAVKRGDRTLTADELRAYLAALGDDLSDLALRLALLAGGQRIAQVLRAKVADYDPDTATLRLWDGKGKRQAAREHLLPLGPRGAALAAALVERAKAKESPWLFSTHGTVAMTFTTPGKRLAEICAAMGGEPFDLRDIRRTVETMLAGMGISRDTRAQLLSHGISGVQAAHYDRHAYTNEKRAALVAWEGRIEEIRTGTPAAANVVGLRRA